MEARKIESPKWLFIALCLVLGGIAGYLLVSRRQWRAKYQRLVKQMGLEQKRVVLEQKNDLPKSKVEQAAEIEEVPDSDDGIHQQQTSIVIPASLRYKVSLSDDSSFDVVPTSKQGGKVKVVVKENTIAFFKHDENDQLLHTETRQFPVSEKEIGTILTTLLLNPKNQ